MEAIISLGNLQPPHMYQNPLEQRIAGMKVFDPFPDATMPEALDADNVRPMECTVTASNEEDMLFYRDTELSSCTDGESLHERLEESILDRAKVGVEGEQRYPTELIPDGTETLPDSVSRHVKKEKLASIRSQVIETLSTREGGHFCASLKVQWDILGFMNDQFRDDDFPNTDLGPVITISVFAQHAQATTCSEYIR